MHFPWNRPSWERLKGALAAWMHRGSVENIAARLRLNESLKTVIEKKVLLVGADVIQT